MTTMSMDAIKSALSAYNIGTSKDRIVELAMAIQGKRALFDADTVGRLFTHYKGLGRPEHEAKNLLEACLLDGSWVELHKDLLAELSADREAADAQRLYDSGFSDLDFVTEANPYGWKMVEQKRAQDHNRPGEWNPFRQCFNLTTSERAKAAARDFKRRGCSRYEVMGHSPELKDWRPGKGMPVIEGRVNKVEYDPDEVEAARYHRETERSDDRRVYGS